MQFHVYTSSDKIGSPSVMYDLLVRAADDWPVEGNKDGSYLTFRSKSGLIFMVSDDLLKLGDLAESRSTLTLRLSSSFSKQVINLVGNMGTVFNDQAYWQRCAAASPVFATLPFAS